MEAKNNCRNTDLAIIQEFDAHVIESVNDMPHVRIIADVTIEKEPVEHVDMKTLKLAVAKAVMQSVYVIRKEGEAK